MTGAIIAGLAFGLLYLIGVFHLQSLRELSHLRDLCRRCSDHLISEYHDGIGIRDKETHLGLYSEMQMAGWDVEGRER